MKKVAIMTWYSYRNFGTALQAAAMPYVISKLGYKPFNISYDPEPVQRKNNRVRRSLVKRIIKRAKWVFGPRPLASKERNAAFDRFISSNLNFTEEVAGNELVKLSDFFDAFVCGSDQIWSPRCFDAHYYLDFVSNPSKKIAYAPSFGCESITDNRMASRIASLIQKFGSIAVREKTGASIVEHLIGVRPQVVLDPTLLLDAEEWQGFSNPYPINTEEPYCLFYFLGSYSGNRRAAYKIAESRGLKVLEIPVFQQQIRQPSTLGADIGPAEFVSLIRDAELVCTDSFHGMVFATILNSQFVPFERFEPEGKDSQNTRVYNYLDVVGLKKILLTRAQLGNWRDYADPFIDFETVMCRIRTQREESLQYLKNALAAATTCSIEG